MANNSSDPARLRMQKYRFGSFEVDLEQQELYNRGIRIALQRKPFKMLELLLRKRGTLVSRDELADYLWPDLHVSFDRGLNTVVNVLRRALGDSPGNCRYIETRSGLGYRFIGHVEEIGDRAVANSVHVRQPRSFEAYEDYLKARYFYAKMTEPDLQKSIVLYESALKLDPNYAQAYTGLAATYNLMALLGLTPASVAHSRIKEYAIAALGLDDLLPEAHAAIAGVKKWFEWDWDGAEKEYRIALELDPCYADGRRGYAALLCCLGRIDAAKREIWRAQEIEPLSIVISTEIAWTLYMSRDFRAAVEQSWKALTLEARHAPAQNTLGLACQQLGMLEEAVTELENARTCSGNHPATIAALAHVHACSGNESEALKLLHELREISARRYVSPYWLAMVQAGLGAYDAAFEWLERAFEDRDVWLVWMKMEPRFDPIRSDPRFARALARLRMQ